MAVAKDSLIDSHVSTQQCTRAVDALLKHALAHEAKRAEHELLPGKEQNVWLQFTVKQMHAERKLKPVKIALKYPLVDPRTTGVCLITKDPQREYKDLLDTHNIKFVSRVVGIAKLKGKFRPFEARRLLLQENGLFLADERVVPLLPKLLGSVFFKAKKQPIPVCLTRKDLKGELERAVSSTYMHQNQGTCLSIKVGLLSQTPAQILANIASALPAIVAHIRGNWDNVQGIALKTNQSAALPVWSVDLAERWTGMDIDVKDAEAVLDDDDDEEESAEEVQVKEKAKAKGKKRAAEADDGEAVGAKKAKKPRAEEPAPAKEKKGKADDSPAKEKKKEKKAPATAAPPSPAPSKKKAKSVEKTGEEEAPPVREKKEKKAPATVAPPSPAPLTKKAKPEAEKIGEEEAPVKAKKEKGEGKGKKKAGDVDEAPEPKTSKTKTRAGTKAEAETAKEGPAKAEKKDGAAKTEKAKEAKEAATKPEKVEGAPKAEKAKAGGEKEKKRTADAGERKKEKVLKGPSKVGKSAKEEMLGLGKKKKSKA